MKRILIVDDNSTMLRLYQYHIEQRGWSGHYFDSGQEALEKLREVDPDVAILDYDLKNMVGTDIYEALHREFPDKNIPVIFITAQIMAEIKNKLRSLDNASILNKPFSPTQLVQAIERLISE